MYRANLPATATDSPVRKCRNIHFTFRHIKLLYEHVTKFYLHLLMKICSFSQFEFHFRFSVETNNECNVAARVADM
jgi:hypothetical protein